MKHLKCLFKIVGTFLFVPIWIVLFALLWFPVMLFGLLLTFSGCVNLDFDSYMDSFVDVLDWWKRL